MKNLMDIFDQAKQFIEANKSENPNSNLSTTFHKYMGESNLYIQFGYGLQKNFNIPEDKFRY